MLDKIVQIEKKYVELGQTLSDPDVIADYNKFRDLSKQRKSMEETVELYYAWKKAVDAIEEAKQLIHEEKDEENEEDNEEELEEDINADFDNMSDDDYEDNDLGDLSIVTEDELDSE